LPQLPPTEEEVKEDVVDEEVVERVLSEEDLMAHLSTSPSQSQSEILVPESPHGRRTATALYDYMPEEGDEDEVPLVQGATVEVVNNDNEDWWLVRSGNRSGLVPANYLALNPS